MARLIDADNIDFSDIKNDFDRARAKIIIMGQPTIDLVSEERCREIAQETARILKQITVNEIFNEINQILFDYEYAIYKDFRSAFQERFNYLKKKYTESEDKE